MIRRDQEPSGSEQQPAGRPPPMAEDRSGEGVPDAGHVGGLEQGSGLRRGYSGGRAEVPRRELSPDDVAVAKSKIIVCAPMLQFFVPVHQYQEPTCVLDATTGKRE
jgi:hypothetical protein